MKIVFKKNGYLQLLTLVFLLFAVVRRILSLFVNTYGGYYDDYNQIPHGIFSFSNYLRHLGGIASFPQAVYFWTVSLLFKDNLVGYLIGPVTVSILAIVVLYFGIGHFWKSALVTFLIISFLAFNNHLLFLSEYAVFTYANGFLISTVLLFLFLKLTSKGFSTGGWVYVLIPLLLLMFFSELTIILPIFSGFLALVLFNLLNGIKKGQPSISLAIKICKRYMPLLILILPFIVIYKTFTLTNISAKLRPDMAPFFFPRGIYSINLTGLLEYIRINSINLFGGLLLIRLSEYQNISFQISKFVLTSGLLLGICGIYLVFKNSKIGKYTKFLLLYTGITYFLTLLGGLAGVFPFGSPRYNYYLLVQLSILGALFLCYLLALVKRKILYINRFEVPVYFIFFLLGLFYLGRSYLQINDINRQNKVVFQNIRTTHSDLVLFTSRMAPILKILAPDMYEEGVDMGWGAFWNSGVDPGIPAMVETEIITQKPGILAVVSYKRDPFDNYPSWKKLIDNKYKQAKIVSSPSIWTVYYEKKM